MWQQLYLMLWLFLFVSLSPALIFASGPRRPSFLSNSNSAIVGSAGNGQQDRDTTATLVFPHNLSAKPFLAVITEVDACDTDKRLQETLGALFPAIQRNQVDLISVRVHGPDKSNDATSININNARQERVLKLTQQLVAWADNADYQFRVVLSSDWRHVAAQAKVHGVHVKESHRQWIPDIRQDLGPSFLIGTSAHSIESACAAYDDYQVDYLFIGTCFVTESHPEKDPTRLEGPELPGQVCRALKDLFESSNSKKHPPPVLAIGGIDASNCHIPIQFGADGVATIRAVLQAQSPLEVVQDIKSAMLGAL
jgi:thiamine-phosphate diphosphorylase